MQSAYLFPTVNLRNPGLTGFLNNKSYYDTIIIEIATNCRYQENMKEKHFGDAKKGWYRYTSNFALPVYDEDGAIQRYNVFRIEMLVRHSQDGKKYLYDLVNIKKRTEHPA